MSIFFTLGVDFLYTLLIAMRKCKESRQPIARRRTLGLRPILIALAPLIVSAVRPHAICNPLQVFPTRSPRAYLTASLL